MAKQPEALATFAASAKNKGKKPKEIGLEATTETEGIPTNSAKKDEAARKVLREGVLHTDQGADEAIDALPDRTRSDRA
jgi:predicted NBD/HSP70 family sugar kinase